LTELTPQSIAMGLTAYVVLLFSLSVHESAHGWMALRLGDDTAASQGRVSLNPIVHIDPIGTILMPLLMFLFGGIPLLAWAKPTPYEPANFSRERSLAQGHILVAAAGPISNVILALLFTVMLAVGLRAGLIGSRQEFAFVLLAVGIQMNVALAVFNLVPLPPLDGSKVASWGLPRSAAETYDQVMEPYGQWILLALLVTGILGFVMQPVLSLVIGVLDLLLQLIRQT
jgi:Zn-dependent protease